MLNQTNDIKPSKATRLEGELAELATLPMDQLRSKWADAFNRLPPRVPVSLLRRLLAQHLQERRYGKLPVVMTRELERMASCSTPDIKPPQVRPKQLTPGARLIREWSGRTISVEVAESGFVWEERQYRSLSEIAREVTGAHWSGPRFFGLHRHG